jgi:hypothetical protein
MSCLPTTLTTQPRANSISRFVGAQEHRAPCWILEFCSGAVTAGGPTPVGELPTAANELIGRGDEDTLRGEAALSS